MVFLKFGFSFGTECGCHPCSLNRGENTGAQDPPANNAPRQIQNDEQEPQQNEEVQQPPPQPDEIQEPEPTSPDEHLLLSTNEEQQQHPESPNASNVLPESSSTNSTRQDLVSILAPKNFNKQPSIDITVNAEKDASDAWTRLRPFSLHPTQAINATKAIECTTTMDNSNLPSQQSSTPSPHKRPHTDAKAKVETGSLFGSKKARLSPFSLLEQSDIDFAKLPENEINNAFPQAVPSSSSSSACDNSADNDDSTNGFYVSDPNISIHPSVEVINERVQKDDNYSVDNLTITHNEHGSVRFEGTRSLRRLFESDKDLAKLGKFGYGLIGITNNIQLYPIVYTFQNITRQSFAQQTGKANLTDQELQKTLYGLGIMYGASFSSYNESNQTWILKMDSSDQANTTEKIFKTGHPDK